MALDQANKSAYHDLERVQNKLEEEFKILISVSEKIYIDKDIVALADMEYYSDLQVTEMFRKYATFDQYLNLYSEIKSIRLYLDNKTVLNTGQFMKAGDRIKGKEWYKSAVAKDGLISWEYEYDEIGDAYSIHLTRLVKDFFGKHIGVLSIAMNNDYLIKYLKGETFDIYVIDKGRVVTAKNREIIGQALNQLELGKYLNLNSLGEETVDGIINGDNVKILSKSFSPAKGDTNFTIVAVLPTDKIATEANKRSFLGFVIITISLAASLGLIILFTKTLSRRITVLTRQIHQVAQGQLDTEITIIGRDEIGQLAQDIGVMIKSIKDLMHNAYEANLQKGQLELKQKEMQFKMLSSQVNPHFLFNTLETIRMKAIEYGQKELSDKIKQLAYILRASLQMENKEIPLVKELELVRSYLEIQKYRFEERINYAIRCEKQFEKNKVLSFIIQPIVENSIIHGIESKFGQGKVKIIVSAENQKLIITIIDNGIGIEKDKLNTILENISDIHKGDVQHIGIINVSQRIKLFYGQEYGLEIKTERNKGTEIRIIIPSRSEES